MNGCFGKLNAERSDMGLVVEVLVDIRDSLVEIEKRLTEIGGEVEDIGGEARMNQRHKI